MGRPSFALLRLSLAVDDPKPIITYAYEFDNDIFMSPS